MHNPNFPELDASLIISYDIPITTGINIIRASTCKIKLSPAMKVFTGENMIMLTITAINKKEVPHLG